MKENPQASSELTDAHKNNIKNSLYTQKTEMQKLEYDLRYLTGKADRLEVEEKIKALEEKVKDSPEAQMIEAENENNFTRLMSFDQNQIEAMENVNRALDHHFRHSATPLILPNDDIGKKREIDRKVKFYRSQIANRENLGNDNLDNLVLAYEKAFLVNSETLLPSAQKYERELRDKNFKLEQERKEAIRYVEGKMSSLASLKERLLEEQANAKVSILGRKDSSKTGPLEKQIAEIKREITLDLFAAASIYLRFNVEPSDLGL